MCEKAISARKAQAMIGIPFEEEFKDQVRKKCIALKSIPVIYAIITNAHTIFGTKLSGVRGGGSCETEATKGRKLGDLCPPLFL